MKAQKAEIRKVPFNLYPGDNPGDRITAALIDNTRLKERGAAMRDLLLTGAALSMIDERLPRLIASVLDDEMGLDRVTKLISSIVPDAFIAVERDSEPAVPAGLPTDEVTSSDSLKKPDPVQDEKKRSLRDMRQKANAMFGGSND